MGHGRQLETALHYYALYKHIHSFHCVLVHERKVCCGHGIQERMRAWLSDCDATLVRACENDWGAPTWRRVRERQMTTGRASNP